MTCATLRTPGLVPCLTGEMPNDRKSGEVNLATLVSVVVSIWLLIIGAAMSLVGYANLCDPVLTLTGTCSHDFITLHAYALEVGGLVIALLVAPALLVASTVVRVRWASANGSE